MIGTSEVPDYSVGHRNAHVTNEREEPSEYGNWSPYDTEGISVVLVIDHRLVVPTPTAATAYHDDPNGNLSRVRFFKSILC